MIFSLVSSGASNFWNHVNDVNEDIKNNKVTVLTEEKITKNKALIISLLLYLFSILLSIYMSSILKRPLFIFFIVWVIITWWYSDDIFLKKITGVRLKTHYFGEILTYGLAYPAYTMSIWLIFSDSFLKGFVLSMIFFCFGIAGVLLKDLKDIKGDREAGLRTLGVVFAPSKLIKISCFFLIVYFCIILLSTNQGIFNFPTFIIIFPLMYLIKNTVIHFHCKNWNLEIGDLKNIRSMIISTYSSIFILGFTNFF